MPNVAPLRVILNADDFGYDDDTVCATIDAFERGLLTSATIMTNMPASGVAIEWAREHPEYSFGVHLVWVGSGTERPVADPSLVRTLVRSNGPFKPSHEMRVRGMVGLVSVEEIALEARLQISRLRDGGVTPSHVDAHGHLHKYGAFRAALERVLPGLNIHRVRSAQDVYLQAPRRSVTRRLGPYWRRRLDRAFTTTDHFYMPASDGATDWDTRLADALRGRGGTVEIGVHPGRRDRWRAEEIERLAAFRETVNASELVDWRAVGLLAPTGNALNSESGSRGSQPA